MKPIITLILVLFSFVFQAQDSSKNKKYKDYELIKARESLLKQVKKGKEICVYIKL